MNFLGGVGKAGTNIMGGAVKGAGKLVETLGEATESTGIIGSGVAGGVVEGTGKAIDTVGEAMKEFGDAVFSKQENKPKINLEDIGVGQIHVDMDGDITTSNENSILPKCVTFKNNNGEYLKPWGKYLKFSAASSVEDSAADFDIISMKDGYVRIRHANSGKYWIRDPDWIHCKSIDTKKDDPNTLFFPIKVDNNIVALRNKGNQHYCKSLTSEGKFNCLNAAVLNITDDARLEVTRVKSVEEHPLYTQGYVIGKY